VDHRVTPSMAGDTLMKVRNFSPTEFTRNTGETINWTVEKDVTSLNSTH